MTIDTATIHKIAHLARLKIEPSEVDGIATDLNRILDWVAQLETVDLNDVEPMHNVSHQELRRFPDEITAGGDAAAIVANAPQSEFCMFSVPKVVE